MVSPTTKALAQNGVLSNDAIKLFADSAFVQFFIAFELGEMMEADLGYRMGEI
jgi:hypothetical protein